MALAYSLALLLVYVLAVADYFRIGLNRGVHVGRRRVLLQTYSLRWINYWVMLQAAAVGIFWATGDKRGVRMATFYLTGAIMMLMIIPAGQHYAAQLRIPSFTLFGGRTRGAGRIWINRSTALREFALLFGVVAIATAAFVKLVPWKVDPSLELNFKTAEHSQLANALFAGYVIVAAAVTEEILFRHYLVARLMNLFQKHGRQLAIILSITITSAVFAIGHTNMIIPAWLKFAQICMLGIALGLTRVRLGSDYAIVMHILFNLTMALLASSL